uniref:Uncharacterized protein n=1 Tax=Fagus sylvatica TaxID=28930 RepID=A0A2N9FYA0_FAGSY
MKGKGRAGPEVVGPRAGPSCAAHDGHARVPKTAPFHHFKPQIVFRIPTDLLQTWNTHLDPGRTGTQTETNCATAVGERGNRENPSGQKSSHLFFVQRSLCQETPNKEGATVITPFLPPGFSRVSARKTRQPEPSRPVPTRAHHIKYSQEEGPETHFPSVCAKILSDPLQLGPRAKTLRQEVHFSYHMQLSDRQEFLRSSRNLSQKMTPWHEEHSDGLCSQDHILRTQTRLCARPVPLEKVFLTRNKLICEPGHIGKKTHSCTTWNSRIAKNLSGPAGIPIGKLPSNGPKTPRWPLFAGPYLTSPSSDFRKSWNLAKSRQRKLSDGTKNVKIRHRELGQICARTGTRFEKKRAGSKTHFFSRTAAFARRVFPARNKLIREPGCVGKIMTPATTWNSRFADSIPRLTGIYIGRVHKNSSDTPTSGSHNSLVRTPIRANFISLERGRRELSDDMPHDPF